MAKNLKDNLKSKLQLPVNVPKKVNNLKNAIADKLKAKSVSPIAKKPFNLVGKSINYHFY